MAYTARTGAAKKYAYIKGRISKAQSKAKAIGLLYLLATLAITALTCLSLVTVSVAKGNAVSLGVQTIIQDLTSLKEKTLAKWLLTIYALYGVLIVVLLVNVIRSFVNLGWLFKKKASRTYGLNRNMYAMEKMGKIFSGSLSSIVFIHFCLFTLPNAEARLFGRPVPVIGRSIEIFAWVTLAVGIFFHFLCGILGGNISLFETENGIVTERKRELGNFSPFVRNVLQLVAVGAMMFLVSKTNLLTTVYSMYNRIGNAHLAQIDEAVWWQNAILIAWSLIIPVLCCFVAWFIVLMMTHALGTKEFSIEGSEARGRKKYLLFAFLTVVTVAGIFVMQRFVETNANPGEVMTQFLIVGGIALAMVIVELCTHNCPKPKTENLDDVDTGMYLSENYNRVQAYIAPVYVQANVANGQNSNGIPDVRIGKVRKAPKKKKVNPDEIDVGTLITANYNTPGAYMTNYYAQGNGSNMAMHSVNVSDASKK